MPVCSQCGVAHAVLDPAFRRPEAYVQLERRAQQHAKANDDLCSIALPGTPPRFFVRGTLAVRVANWPDGVHWGLWAEISEPAFQHVLDTWSDPSASDEPPFVGTLANMIPSYPDTLGLPLVVRLTGPTTRPAFVFGEAAQHAFVDECRGGVTLHRVHEWNRLWSIG